MNNILERILSDFQAKGWNLYRALPQRDLPTVAARGKIMSIELNVVYVMLPIADRHDDPKSVLVHMIDAIRTRQLPSYIDRISPRRQIEFISITDMGLHIKVEGEKEICFDHDQMRDAVRHNISNYNVYYFRSIEQIERYFLGINIQVRPSVSPEHLRWTYVATEDPETAMIYPRDLPSLLFRGQHTRYTPCYPTAARGIVTRTSELRQLPQEEQSTIILNLIKTQWFIENLRETEAIKWMSHERVSCNLTAVAQHYGLPTGYLDLSQSLEVASFFASSKYDAECDKWVSVGEGEGVIYVVDRGQLRVGEVAIPICLQPFPRPSEQWGWVHEVSLGQDFDGLPHIRKFVFKHDAIAANRILERFEGGAKLFPQDPLSDVADRIVQSREIPVGIARDVVDDLINERRGIPDGTRDDIIVMVEKNMRVKFSVSCSRFVADKRMRYDMNTIWERKKQQFYNSIGFRLVFDRDRLWHSR